ncbi:MAG TPA: hypothetical protein DEB17_11565 [Chlorobaculum sp.]|uniref:Uncharacterized protein n=1 Tax=Chlorobaculum tepidum (strain ATCC 49652 / DSM 12025 / NBRC 103806 / TLS) TaxID=194439 RepID=Q8KCV0_CHLTE|nr:hypothetical protein CT1310 [Chlorobaculum tepidum TLS]HBU24602.1 hypothetical protein [Chlorobaculum sp.]
MVSPFLRREKNFLMNAGIGGVASSYGVKKDPY